jgi:predicted ATP-grasp superfamily ATP-dependent carboligase
VLIAPETGGLLLERALMIERVGGRSLGPTPAAIDLAGDKERLGAHLARHGVATPPCRRVRPRDGLPIGASYPAVLKPLDGAGAVDTYFVESPDACPAAARALGSALFQPFVAGVSLSASFLTAEVRGATSSLGENPALVGVASQRFERQGGRFRYLGGSAPVREPVPLDEVRRAVAAVEGLRGWLGVDFVWDPHSGCVTVLEINPRLTTSYVGLGHLYPPGALAAWWLGDTGELGAQRPGPTVHFNSTGAVEFEGGPA